MSFVCQMVVHFWRYLFPARRSGNGLVPWPQLLVRISDFYQKSREELTENAEAIRNNLLASSASSLSNKDFDSADLNIAVQGICGNHDDQYGGLGKLQNFHKQCCNFLMSMRDHKEMSKELRERIVFVLSQLLRQWLMGNL